MSIVKEMRERQTVTVAPERSGLGGTLLIGCAAFAIGVLAILGWKMWPGAKAPAPSASQHPSRAALPQARGPGRAEFSGKRLGEAERAPLPRPASRAKFRWFGRHHKIRRRLYN